MTRAPCSALTVILGQQAAKHLSAVLQAYKELRMTSVLTPTGSIETLADLLQQLGGVAPERVRFRPLPGTATEHGVLDIQARTGRLCELVDGVLVEKGLG